MKCITLQAAYRVRARACVDLNSCTLNPNGIWACDHQDVHSPPAVYGSNTRTRNIFFIALYCTEDRPDVLHVNSSTQLKKKAQFEPELSQRFE